jgi:PHP family Zn ribbon phosphoesterase
VIVTVFPDLTYDHVSSAIIDNDPERFKFTIETDPAYGKYHWTGHRNCKVSFPTSEAIKHGNVCPVCRRMMTKGVEQRVEELADREKSQKRTQVPGFKYFLPLSEIICAFLGIDTPGVQEVWKPYNMLLKKFGDEYNVLINATLKDLVSIVDTPLAHSIIKVREGLAKVTPGYDGVYGRLILGTDTQENKPNPSNSGSTQQRSMSDFF